MLHLDLSLRFEGLPTLQGCRALQGSGIGLTQTIIKELFLSSFGAKVCLAPLGTQASHPYISHSKCFSAGLLRDPSRCFKFQGLVWDLDSKGLKFRCEGCRV